MTIGIVSNATRDTGFSYAKEIASWLTQQGCTPILQQEEAFNSQFLIVLGGDGTMLRASHSAAKYSTPMLGINLGSLGYLTDVDRHDGLAAVKKMLAGDFRREQRMMLETREALALNEVLISRERSSKLMAFRICVNGDHMDTLRADGVIVSTPTGSTAYNLSSGGPILRPDSEMMVVTAVCPHSLYTRPWVLSAHDEVTLTPVDSCSDKAVVSLDGEAKFFLEYGETITIKRSKHMATVVKTSGMDFFEVLRKKMAK